MCLPTAYFHKDSQNKGKRRFHPLQYEGKSVEFLFLSLKESACSWCKLKHISSNNSASSKHKKRATLKNTFETNRKIAVLQNASLYHPPATSPGTKSVENYQNRSQSFFFTNLLLDIRSFHIVLRLTLLKLTGQQHKLQLDGLD